MPSPSITLFEHEVTAAPLTIADLRALERMRYAVGAEILRPTIHKGQMALQATEYVGVIRLPDHTVQVLPKTYRAGETEPVEGRAAEATANLLHMLALSGQLPIREHDVAPLLRGGSDWFEILTRIFATHLAAEWQRGSYRTYETRDDELRVLKGRWRLADQLRRPDRGHLFTVSYDEFTSDNALNRVFRFVVERLWRLTRDAGNRQTLGTLRAWMEDVAMPPQVSSEEAARCRVTRLNQRYAPILAMARVFLDGGALQTAVGDVRTFAFVFDMNRLFEVFVAAMVQRHRTQVLPLEHRDCDILPQSAGIARHLARSGGRAAFRLAPDIVIQKGGSFPLLVDTKYKRLQRNVANFGISASDFYQMYAYAQRFNCPRVVLIYPETAGFSQHTPIRFHLEGYDTLSTIEAATIDIRRDFAKPAERIAFVESLARIFKGENTDA